MKTITIIWILTTFFAWGCSQKKPVERTILGMGTDYMYYPEVLNGKIKVLKETNYWAAEEDGKITKGVPATWKDLDSINSIKNFVAYYDNSGVLTRYDHIDENNVIRSSSVATVENGVYVKWENKSKDSTVNYMIPEYNSKKYLTGGKIYRPIVDTLISGFVITYDEKGNYTRIEYFDSKNQKRSYQVFTLNDLGNVIEVKFYSGADSLLLTFENTYNDKGFLVSQKSINENQKETSLWISEEMEFDDHDNVVLISNNIDDGKFRIVAERVYTYY